MFGESVKSMEKAFKKKRKNPNGGGVGGGRVHSVLKTKDKNYKTINLVKVLGGKEALWKIVD